MKKDIGIGILGFGTVGSGVYQILSAKASKLAQRVGADLRVVLVAEKAQELFKDKVPVEKQSGDANEVINHPDVDIVVEVIGGIEPAYTFIKNALENGKHVVTANKALMASRGGALLELAERKGVDLFFEASVGGGIPIIRPLKYSLVGNTISRVMGIVNGTTNYILTKMVDEGMPLEAALKEAQELGFAEADPTADVEGHDAAAKIAILASIAFNSRVVAEQVYTEGIMDITQADIAYAKEMGYAIKLLALAKEDEDGVDVRVHPAMIPADHPLAQVSGVMNAIFIEGDAVGEVMFYGPGAGSLPAASAIVGDVFEVALNISLNKVGSAACSCFESKKVKTIDEVTSRYYMRLEAADRPGVLAKISQVFGEDGVSIESVIQKNTRRDGAELVFGFYMVKEKNFRESLKKIERLDVVNKICNVIRVEE
ncbi:MAG: homoserine dehydrogenase [Candidatus Aquicultor sp.]|nr:homoserine dehydrogenase [Candidatus Aquicultor sp.]